MGRAIDFRVLKGTLANMPALASGEMYFASDTGELYVGPAPTRIAANKAQAVVNFGASPTASEDTTASVTVAAAWVAAASKLLCCVAEGQDHTADEIASEQVSATAGNIVPGTGFDIVLSAPNGASGKFLVNVEG